MAGRPSWRSWPAASARTPPRGSFAGIMRPNSTSCGTSSPRKSRTPGRSGSGTRVSHPKANTGRWFHPGNPRRYVYRKAVSSSETVRSLSDQTHVSCPVCGHYNPADATVCGACAFVLSNLSPEEKVDAILEDLLDLSKAPMAEAKPAPPPAPEEPEVDEVAAEELFAGIAGGGMLAALLLFRISNSAVAQGDHLVKQGRYQEALTHYERAIRLVRRPSYAWTSRGVAMRYLGRIDEALRCHENAIRLDAENEVAWCNLGTVYFKKGLLAKALDCYDRAIKIRPKYAIAWNNKGVVYARMNRFEDADKCHAKATKLRPEYVAAWLNRGEVLARLGAREEAEKCLERARSISRSAAA